MPNPADVARARIAALRAEIAELERFLDMYFRLAGSADRTIATASQALPLHENVNGRGNETSADATQQSVDNSGSYAKRVRLALARANIEAARQARMPETFASHMERIIREVGRPMTRGEIVAAMDARDIHIPYEDKARYLGTIAWRHKGTFEHVEGRGYWIRGEPVPPVEAPAPAEPNIFE